MGNKLVVGPINRGLKNDRIAFVIDNDSFPNLFNAYQWRGRVKRKRGTSFLGRLTRYFNSLSAAYGSTTTITLDGSGNGNLLIGFLLQTNGNIVPGSVTITAPGPTVFTDPGMDGSLSPSGTINYATGAITILAKAGVAVSAVFRYYPDLPVMGLRDFVDATAQFPNTLGFDTRYSYNIGVNEPISIYDVSFYKNPATDAYTNYVQKTVETPTSWNGEDYQQFWTVNYQGALWATNGIPVPFVSTKIGMQFKTISVVDNITGGPPAVARLHIATHGLVEGDFVFVNEVVTTTGINFQTGYVTSVDPQDPGFVDVTFPNATIATDGTGGIAQYLTSRSDVTKDCLRFYDGDPTNGSSTAPVLNGHKGWVNFAPPLSQDNFSVGNLPAAKYYLVGARVIQPYKDRLLFFGPVVQTSTGAPIYLQDTVVYSQNGTAYYTASYTNSPDATKETPTTATTVFNPILVPANQSATSPAYFADSTGFGGNITVGLDEPINTVSSNEDVLILGFTTNQVRLVYTGIDVLPFNFFLINSELGSSSTFSVINMDRGVLTRGDRGFVISSQVETQRFDLDIPDENFETKLTQNGTERFTAQRDFKNEWVYFTYPVNSIDYKFPTQTLQYNYRDQTWGIFYESYTTYGTFRLATGLTWATIGTKYPTWGEWNDPWNAGASTLLQPDVIAGNQQGFVVYREEGTGESNSLYIRDISAGVLTVPDHCLSEGDYITISGCLGTISTEVNGLVFSVQAPVTTDTFALNPPIASGTYFGGGLIKRMYNPFIQSKQFPVSWEMMRKTRLGPQQYLLTKTPNSQITLLIYLSQDGDNAYNQTPINPDPNAPNNALVYSTILYTCPESTNLGLTPLTTNLQMPTAVAQQQIWHRVNTSLIGDTVQVAFTMSDEQMRDPNLIHQFAEIEVHGFILDVSGSSLLA